MVKYILLMGIFIQSCQSFLTSEKPTFDSYSVEEVIELQRFFWRLSAKDGIETTISHIDSLVKQTDQNQYDLHYFFFITKTFENAYSGNDSIKYVALNKLLDLSIDAEFQKKHELNRAYVHYFIARILIKLENTTKAIVYLEKGIKEIEHKSVVYNRLLSLFYVEEYRFKRNEYVYDKAIAFAESIKDYWAISSIYSSLAGREWRKRNYIATFKYDKKAEWADKKSEYKINWNYHWRRHYSNRISLLYSLDEKYPATEEVSYRDTISAMFNLLESDYQEQKINSATFYEVIKLNINSLIKIKEYNKAEKYIQELELKYAQDSNDNCYDKALLHMNKYVWERSLGTDRSYLKALYHSYDHMVTCGNPKLINYGIMKTNVLEYLITLEAKLGNYKKSAEWSELRNQTYLERRENPVSEKKIKQARFWAKRESDLAEQSAKLNEEKAKLLRGRFCILTVTSLLLVFLFFAIYRMYVNTQKKKRQITKNKKQLQQNILTLKKLNENLEKSAEKTAIQKKKVEAELKSRLLYILQRNEMLSNLEDQLENMDLTRNERNRLTALIKANNDKVLQNEIEKQYLKAHREFVELLKERYPNLSFVNIKMCIFIKLGLSTKEIASLTFAKVQSVKVARSRLYKKLGIDSTVTNAYSFLNSLS